jgi:hypothetical protein
MSELLGKLKSFTEHSVTIDLDEKEFHQLARLSQGQAIPVGIHINDGRHISAEQNRYIHAIIGDIANWYGDDPQIIKDEFKFWFAKFIEVEEYKVSQSSVEDANEFINYLLTFVVRHDVPLSKYSPLEMLAPDDVALWELRALYGKFDVLDGTRPSDLHHLDHRQTRKGNDQVGLRVIQLSREHHVEAHNLGTETFLKKYLLKGTVLTPQLIKELKL